MAAAAASGPGVSGAHGRPRHPQRPAPAVPHPPLSLCARVRVVSAKGASFRVSLGPARGLCSPAFHGRGPDVDLGGPLPRHAAGPTLARVPPESRAPAASCALTRNRRRGDSVPCPCTPTALPKPRYRRPGSGPRPPVGVRTGQAPRPRRECPLARLRRTGDAAHVTAHHSESVTAHPPSHLSAPRCGSPPFGAALPCLCRACLQHGCAGGAAHGRRRRRHLLRPLRPPGPAPSPSAPPRWPRPAL